MGSSEECNFSRRTSIPFEYGETMSDDKKETPIIALTAAAIKGEKEKCFSIGMNDYISKPFKSKELIEKIINIIT